MLLSFSVVIAAARQGAIIFHNCAIIVIPDAHLIAMPIIQRRAALQQEGALSSALRSLYRSAPDKLSAEAD
ncbi:hypothetical protein RKLH11_336 [Rhodobacteraceae bacterium KLH11]|nr:hypothetical protein RKLH11_336 [Rhodobacteraceae bacterium KLH11]